MSSERSLPSLLRNVSTKRIIRALARDGFSYDAGKSASRTYWHPDGRRAVIHYHHGNDTQPPFVLTNLLTGTHWTEEDLRRLKLTK